MEAMDVLVAHASRTVHIVGGCEDEERDIGAVVVVVSGHGGRWK